MFEVGLFYIIFSLVKAHQQVVMINGLAFSLYSRFINICQWLLVIPRQLFVIWYKGEHNYIPALYAYSALVSESVSIAHRVKNIQ